MNLILKLNTETTSLKEALFSLSGKMLNNLIHIGLWDIFLVVAVSLQATLVAYLYQPRWKAFILTLPIPFTIAALAVGVDINTYNIAGLALVLMFTYAVKLVHYQLKSPIILAIVVACMFYIIISILFIKLVPATNNSFWGAVISIFASVFLMAILTPNRIEPGYRTPLPIWIKLPIIAAVILFLVVIKKSLQGFMTVFPMVGLITAYEARHSLYTICKQVQTIVLTWIPMIVTCYITQNMWGLGKALLAGWGIFLLILIPLIRIQWSELDKLEIEKED